VYHTTGFDREEIIDLCVRINSVEHRASAPKWPPCLGLFKSVTAALTYMRHNRTQAEIGESFGVSQPTVSRAVSAITPLLPEAVREFVPTADDLDRMPSTFWTAHCSRAGHGPGTRNCTQESTRPPE
jgi:hypothetical protein